MKVRWTRDLVEAQDYIARDNPSAAETVAKRVWEAANNLGEHPEIGRQGHVPGTRECTVSQTPYLIVYRIKDETVEILRVWHGRRNWRGNTPN